jgi:hypothetical protein
MNRDDQHKYTKKNKRKEKKNREIENIKSPLQLFTVMSIQLAIFITCVHINKNFNLTNKCLSSLLHWGFKVLSFVYSILQCQ